MVTGISQQHDETPRYLDTRSAAEYLGLSASYLNKARLQGIGPRFVRPAGCRRILYERADLDAWIATGKSGQDSI